MMTRVVTTPDGQQILMRPIRFYRLTNSVKGANRSQIRRQPDVPPISNGQKTSNEVPVALPNGQFYRIVSPPENALVVPPLAYTMAQILDAFAQTSGFSKESPLPIHFGRGTMGLHRFHRAVDIYGVGGKSIDNWLQEWNLAIRKAAATQNPEERQSIVVDEKEKNIGYKLYKALQKYRNWAQPPGYPVQLFGPWTRIEGPHKEISDRMLYLHRDHIHVAK